MWSEPLYEIYLRKLFASPSDRAVSGVGLLSLAFWDCGFESNRDHWYLYFV